MQDNPSSPLRDSFGREIHYLRLSVTDRCNLRCRYCRVDNSFIPHERVMRYEEMEKLVNLLVPLGVGKVRLTGGEPFVRKGFPEFLTHLRAAHPELDLRLTTNGVMLAPHAAMLKDLGVRVNLSLDSLKPQRFASVTGRDLLPRVLEALDALQHHNVPLKINAVAMRGVNDDELPDFLALAADRGLDVRLIEFMPMGEGTLWSDSTYWPAKEILESAGKLVELGPAINNSALDGPATMYPILGTRGRFGLITPLSCHFCATCNRLRLTSDGRLRTCLFDDREYSLLPLLRRTDIPEERRLELVRRIVERAVIRKPIGADILAKRRNEVARRTMTSIGG